jgi:hypothetical protein
MTNYREVLRLRSLGVGRHIKIGTKRTLFFSKNHVRRHLCIGDGTLSAGKQHFKGVIMKLDYRASRIG